jgi:hypothetical protein
MGRRSLLCTADVCYTCQPPQPAVVHNTRCNTLGKPTAVVGTGKPNAERCGQHQHAQPCLVLHAVSPPLLHYQPHRCHHFTTITPPPTYSRFHVCWLSLPPSRVFRHVASPPRPCSEFRTSTLTTLPMSPQYHHNLHHSLTYISPFSWLSRYPSPHSGTWHLHQGDALESAAGGRHTITPPPLSLHH